MSSAAPGAATETNAALVEVCDVLGHQALAGAPAQGFDIVGCAGGIERAIVPGRG